MARSFLSIFCPQISAARLKELVEWCDLYSPLVSADGEDGIILDIGGCTHLFGGEGPLLIDVHRRLQRMGIPARRAIGDTWGMAWALARYSQRAIVHGEGAVSALDPLPIEALRVPEEIALKLRRLGLCTIAAVRRISQNSLTVRFGPVLLQRLNQIFHPADEPLTPWRAPSLYRAARSLAEPISTVTAVEYVLKELLQEIAARLEKNHLGSRCMDLACHRVDGTVARCEIRTSKPTRSIPHLLRLFEKRLETLRAGFGFENLVLSISKIEALDPLQLSLCEVNSVEDEESFDALVDRLSLKLGSQEVSRMRVCESLLPEHAVEFFPATTSAAASAEWPTYRTRPIRLIEPPMRIAVSMVLPGGAPVQFLIGSRKHRIVRSEGPERLTSEWWRDHDANKASRDYYRIEDENGFRLWIFRDFSDRWFLHGQLP